MGPVRVRRGWRGCCLAASKGMRESVIWMVVCSVACSDRVWGPVRLVVLRGGGKKKKWKKDQKEKKKKKKKKKKVCCDRGEVFLLAESVGMGVSEVDGGGKCSE